MLNLVLFGPPGRKRNAIGTFNRKVSFGTSFYRDILEEKLQLELHWA